MDEVLHSRKGLDLIAQAQTQLRSQPQTQARYDLVICDLRMPHLDGPAFYRELRRQDASMARRIVFVTGDALAPGTVSFLEKSRVPCLAKPFLVEQLKAVVGAALAAADRRGSQGDRRRTGAGSRRIARKR